MIDEQLSLEETMRIWEQFPVVWMPAKKRILLIGHKRNGKDTVAEMMGKLFGYKSKASSLAAAELFIFDALKEKYGYTTLEQCYEDRLSDEMRVVWYDMICAYNGKDKARLAKDILKDNDIYTGMRDPHELWECRCQHVFDLIIGVYDPRKPLEGEGSMKIDIWKESDFIIPNGEGLGELEQRVLKLRSIL